MTELNISRRTKGADGPAPHLSIGCAEAPQKVAEERSKLAELAAEFRDIVQKAALLAGGVQPLPPKDPRARAGEGQVVLASTESHSLRADQPIPLVPVLSHRKVSGQDLWIAVQQPGVLVLNADDNRIMSALRQGLTPSDAIAYLTKDENATRAEAERRVSRMIGRLAAAGFIQGVRGYVEQKKSSPRRFARFHLTKACQLECVHCYSESSPRVDRKGELSTERWIELVDTFASNGGERILFSGGEALIHKGAPAILRAARKAGLHVTLFTNGLLVPRHLAVIQETVDEVQVSLDGPDAASNDPIRGEGTYAKIVRAVDCLLEAEVKTRIGMTAMTANWDAFKREFFNFASRYADKPLEYRMNFEVMTYGRGETITDHLDVRDVQPVAEAFMGAGTPRGPRITRLARGCGYCEQLVIGPTGIVYPCHLLDAPIAHVNEKPLPDIIEIMSKMIRLVDVDNVQGCNTCDIRYLCGGTCRVIDSKTTGSRLVTTCTPQEKERRLSNLVEFYGEKVTNQN